MYRRAHRAERSAEAAVVAVEDSGNGKLGLCSATYVAQASCGKCVFKAHGCYAQYGRVGIITRRLNRAVQEQGLTPLQLARLEAEAIDGLSGDRPLRLHVVGECRTNAAARLVGLACSHYARRGGWDRRGGGVGRRRAAWGYTHSWREVARESWGPDVSILASCETFTACHEAMSRGYAAAVVVHEFRVPQAYREGGLTVLPCPHETAGVKCRECGLCRDADRLLAGGIVIGFQAHSAGAAKVRQVLRALEVV
jgi:hypothetical protein